MTNATKTEIAGLGCELGRIMLASVGSITPETTTVAGQVCTQFAQGLFPASSVDLGNEVLNAEYTIRDVKLDDPALQAELDRIRAEMRATGKTTE